MPGRFEGAFRVGWRLPAAAAVVAVAAAIVAVAPWHGHGNGAIDHELAAVGRGPVVHAVVEFDTPNMAVVSLSTGAERPLRQRLEYWFDSDRRLFRARTSINGHVELDAVIPPRRSGARGVPSLDPALAGFLSGYREALKSGQAREAGRGTFDGRSVTWLRFDYRLFGERVGVDRHTYRPIVIEPLNPDGSIASEIWRVRSIDTRAYRREDFTSAHPSPAETSMHGAGFRMVVAAHAASLLGWTPVWLGTSFRGLPLRYTQLQVVIHERPASGTTRTVTLSYGRGANIVRLTEAKTVEGTFWLRGLGVPDPGTAVLRRDAVTGPGPVEHECRALLRVGGAWVQVEGWNRSASRCTDAARTVARIPR